MKLMPYIDDVHFGSVDIIQSMPVNVSVRTIIGSPDAAQRRRDKSVYGERSS